MYKLPRWLRHSVLSRRRWEKRVSSALSETTDHLVDTAAKRYERIYKQKNFVPIELAFPSLQKRNSTPVGWESSSSLTRGSSTSTSSSQTECTPKDSRLLHVAVLGPQNAGKTSLVNALCLSAVGAVSNRFGSTKDWTKAVATVHSTQLVILDTPGIFVARRKQSERSARWFGGGSAKALDAIFAADAVVLVLPAGLGFVEDEYKKIAAEVAQRAEAREIPLVLVISMMDRVQTPRHREMYVSLRTDLDSMCLPLSATHEVSVKGGTGLVELKDGLCTFAYPSPWQYYRHETTDLSPVDRVAEILRQSYLELLPHEVPHRMSQRLIGWTKKENRSIEVVVEVFFDRPAYLFTFYSKLEAITYRAQSILLRECGERFHFVLQGFVSPGGVSTR